MVVGGTDGSAVLERFGFDVVTSLIVRRDAIVEDTESQHYTYGPGKYEWLRRRNTLPEELYPWLYAHCRDSRFPGRYLKGRLQTYCISTSPQYPAKAKGLGGPQK
jgi:hypothetical protein